MYNILNNSKSGMSAHQNKMNVVSNNMVNANTTGYKRLEAEFQDLITESLYKDSYPTNSNTASTGTGVKMSNEFRNFAQGSIRETGIKSNLAIDGEGFFRVIRPDNTYAYTRNGGFNIDSRNQIVDDNGNILDINFYNNYSYDNLNINSENLVINKQGDVFVDNQRVGKLNLYTSIGDNDFYSIGDSLFNIKNNQNIRVSQGTDLLQGYTEMSNVNMQQEMTDLITIQRAFQMNSKGINVADDMWSMVNNLQAR
ncbi:MAG: flagellar hook-basal body complex protein [Peptostreptococcaceae bacterium]